MNIRNALWLGGLAAILLGPSQANAWPINWVHWNSAFITGQTDGHASGSSGGIGVSYTGELQDIFFDFPSWTPFATFEGGSGTPPLPEDGMIVLRGGLGSVNTIKIREWVGDLYFGIWSLGSSSKLAMFDFSPNSVEVMSGGPNSEYGGDTLFTFNDFVVGAEGNGVVRLPGTYWTVSWTNPNYEDYYGFTFGFGAVSMCGPPVPWDGKSKTASPECIVTPEPMTLALFGVGLCAVGLIVWRMRRRHMDK